MIRSLVLLDMDDTLLGNDMNVFLPHYLELLASSLFTGTPKMRMISRILAATQEMMRNLDPGITLEEVFDDQFYPPLGLSKEELRGAVSDFYAGPYQALQSTTRQLPEAAAVVTALKTESALLAIATNPLFPSLAIRSRLRWAGFEDPASHFPLITSYETLHFAKPNPEFMAECLARLGWPQVTCWMAGNSYDEDILPARSLGLETFFVTDTELPSHAQGPLVDFPRIHRQAKPVYAVPANPRACLAIMRSTAAYFDTLNRSSAGLGESAAQAINQALLTLHKADENLLAALPTDLTNNQRSASGANHREPTPFNLFFKQRSKLISLVDEPGLPKASIPLLVTASENDRLVIRELHKKLGSTLPV